MSTRTKKRPQATTDARTETLEAPAQPEAVLTSDEREEALEAAHAEMQRIEQECSAISAGIDQAQAEIESIETRIEDRHRSVQQAAARVNAALQAYESQEQYCALFAGNTGTTELQRLQRELEKTESDHTALIGEYAHLNDLDTEHIAQIRATIAQDRATIADLQRKSQTLGAARETLRRQHGEALYLECSAILSRLEQEEQECKDAMRLAHAAMLDARSAVIKRVSQWPDIRRKLETEHKVSSDASTEALESFLQLLDVLLKYGRIIDAPSYSMPGGLVSFLSEMKLEPAALQALASGDTSPLAGRRFFLETTLNTYRLNMQQEQGVR